MRINGYQCDTCTKVQAANPVTPDGVPFGWFKVQGSALLLSPSWAFCSESCLYQWSSNRLREEPGERPEKPVDQATVECEYEGKHYKGTVYEVSKGKSRV